MRRFAAGFAIAFILGAGCGIGGARLASVTNPMQAELDANGYSIHGASVVEAVAFDVRDRFGTETAASVGAGATDPSVAPCDAQPPGSIYLRSNGELWLHRSLNPCDWTRVA